MPSREITKTFRNKALASEASGMRAPCPGTEIASNGNIVAVMRQQAGDDRDDRNDGSLDIEILRPEEGTIQAVDPAEDWEMQTIERVGYSACRRTE